MSYKLSKTVNNVHTQSFGGFVAYFNLTVSIWKQFFNSQIFIHLSNINKIKICLLMFFKSFWWLLIKPFGQFFTVKTYIKGSFVSYNKRIPTEHKLKKSVVLNFIGIPLISYQVKLSEENWAELIK